jgi:hypothetical protein
VNGWRAKTTAKFIPNQQHHTTKMSKEQTIVKYFVVETDEYKEPDHPNIFRSSKSTSQLKLKDVKEKFSEWKVSDVYIFIIKADEAVHRIT